MIVSHKHRFIFLKTKKTAGTSIELALTKLCGEDDVITPLAEADEAARAGGMGARNWERHGWWQSRRPFLKRRMFRRVAQDYGFYNHMTAKAAKELLDDDQVWRSYFKFAFDRNPWDRQVSYYHHCYRNQSERPSFDRFVESDRRARLNNFDIYAIDGEVAVDFVGRYETLAEDLKHALSQVHIRDDVALPRAKGTFRKDPTPYRDYYTPETQRRVGEWYQREISLLDYEF
ncbi:hypothetical protein AUC68_11265 [Methyloceanibacter methanicus]|uniref:Sulfotransferase family protein n=1 Tax=Methyloceanibacter methanicus TaxID=1774968 RepID=A0A1E3VXS5_9HYPH|nr:sulfotransferase family 2 domain-containing protein [Methyloceanibacter methanicus]ODR98071.1 hypothetical protein AUC68_11265 [Methyloceanibacter methanicus]